MSSSDFDPFETLPLPSANLFPRPHGHGGTNSIFRGEHDMRRREFIGFVSGAAVSWSGAAWAQQAAKLPTVGFLVAGTPASHGQWVAAFVQRLSELGWIDGRTVAIAYRWAEGHSERYAEIAAEFVRLKVDVIVTTGPAVPAAMQATSVIPVVFALAGDPVGTGLIASLARPGGNVTGLSIQQIDLASKRLELLREIVPGLRRLAIMAKSGRRKISRLPSSRSRGPWMHFMSAPTRSYPPTAFASTPRRWVRDCRRCTDFGTTSKWEV